MSTKQCLRCKRVKPLDQFHKQAQAKDGRQVYCSSCGIEKGAEWRALNRDRQRATERARYAADPEKARERQRKYRERHGERLKPAWKETRRIATLASYGLTLDDYAEMLDGQDNRCALCKSDDPTHWSNQFQVDHDHETGRVRGLLCASCNGGLGLFKDDPILLAEAIDYLLNN